MLEADRPGTAPSPPAPLPPRRARGECVLTYVPRPRLGERVAEGQVRGSEDAVKKCNFAYCVWIRYVKVPRTSADNMEMKPL